MIWLVWITNLITLAAIVVLLIRNRELLVKVSGLRHELDQLRTRQSKIKMARGSVPSVDAKARTVKRDATDLPSSGRMSQGIHRKRSTIDSQLHDS